MSSATDRCPTAARVLEVGSGAHGLVFFFGVDGAIASNPLADEYAASPPMATSAPRRCNRNGEEISPSPTASFDLVLSDNVVDHARSPARSWRRWPASSAPGGLL